MSYAPTHVRRAVPGDLAGIRGIDPLAAAGDHDRARLLERRVRSGEYIVLPGRGPVLGFAVVVPAHFFGRDFIELLAVAPARRRAGAGRALLRAALASAGTSQVFTSTNASNTAMRSLLSDEEWTLAGQIDGLDDGDPELVFFKFQAAQP